MFDLTGGIFGLAKDVLDRVIPDPAQRAAAAMELEKLHQSGDLAVMAQQADINKVEAASPNTFVSGWRPFIGWICGFGLGVQFVFAPLGSWIAALLGRPIIVPALDTGTLTTLLIGMLGLGGMRTMEKLQDKAGNH